MGTFSPRQGLPVADDPWGVTIRYDMDVRNLKRIVAFMEATAAKYAGFDDRQDDLVDDMEEFISNFHKAIAEVEDTIARIRSRER